MTNTVSIIRALLIYGLCLPLAIYLGYILALPFNRESMMIVAVVVLMPLIPILLRWHHILLILSWNMSVVLFFLPASPYLWIVMTAVSLLLTTLQQILKRNVEFASVPSVTLPLLFLVLVVLVTAQLTGGIGIRSLGGEAYGGRRYVIILAAIAGYFAITSQRVPSGRAIAYVALFFLGSVTMIMGSIAPWMPAGLRYLYALFPVESLGAFGGGQFGESTRLGGITLAAASVASYILARHGMGGVLALNERWRFLPLQFRGGFGVNQPWRLLSFLALVWIALMGGYRSIPITFVIILFFLFCLEGLFRTRVLASFILSGVLALAIGLPLVDKMPLMVQRSLSFLPIQVDPRVKQDAEHSTQWRLKMWEEALPTIPQYLLVGKGYSIDPRELEATLNFAEFRRDDSGFGASLASDYHSGPLSLLIPLGAFGALAFLWFMVAGCRVLLHNYRYGEPELHRINTFLLAYFLTKALFFFAVYGSFQNDLVIFTGLLGLSASINGGMRQPAKAATTTNPAFLPFRLPKAAKA